MQSTVQHQAACSVVNDMKAVEDKLVIFFFFYIKTELKICMGLKHVQGCLWPLKLY